MQALKFSHSKNIFHDSTTYFSKAHENLHVSTNNKNRPREMFLLHDIIALLSYVGCGCFRQAKEKILFFFSVVPTTMLSITRLLRATSSATFSLCLARVSFLSIAILVVYMCESAQSRASEKEEEKNGERKLSFEAPATRRGEHSKCFSCWEEEEEILRQLPVFTYLLADEWI